MANLALSAHSDDDEGYKEFIQILNTRNLSVEDNTQAVLTITNSNVAGVVNQFTLSVPDSLKKSVIDASHAEEGMDLNETIGKDGIVSGSIPLWKLLTFVKSNGFVLRQAMAGGKGIGCGAHDKYIFENQ